MTKKLPTIRARLNKLANAILDEAKDSNTADKLEIFREVMRWEQIRNKIGDADDANGKGAGSAFNTYRQEIKAFGGGGQPIPASLVAPAGDNGGDGDAED
jgi:hypothetical protein